MKEYICKEDMAINLTCEIPRKDGDYQDGFSDAIRLIISRFQNLHAVTKADICREFAHELKEAFNNDFPSNYPSTKPFFTLEGVRALVDLVLKEQGNERE